MGIDECNNSTIKPPSLTNLPVNNLMRIKYGSNLDGAA
jgi:hypothetical protein